LLNAKAMLSYVPLNMWCGDEVRLTALEFVKNNIQITLNRNKI
jgi:hypothetical protein